MQNQGTMPWERQKFKYRRPRSRCRVERLLAPSVLPHTTVQDKGKGRGGVFSTHLTPYIVWSVRLHTLRKCKQSKRKGIRLFLIFLTVCKIPNEFCAIPYVKELCNIHTIHTQYVQYVWLRVLYSSINMNASKELMNRELRDKIVLLLNCWIAELLNCWIDVKFKSQEWEVKCVGYLKSKEYRMISWTTRFLWGTRN